MGEDRERRVISTLRQAQQGFPDLARSVQLWPCDIKPPQTEQDRDHLWRLAHLLTQHACLGVGMLHFGRCLPFGHHQCHAEGNVQGQGLVGMLGRLRQGREQLDAGGAVAIRQATPGSWPMRNTRARRWSGV